MIGIWALGAYLAVILLWTTAIKRSAGNLSNKILGNPGMPGASQNGALSN